MEPAAELIQFPRLRSLAHAVEQADPVRDAPLPVDKKITPAHLAAGAKFNSTHSLAHLQRLKDPKVQKDPASVEFHAEHALRHALEVDDHLNRWIEDQASKDPTFKTEYLKVTTQAAAPLTNPPKPIDQPTKPPA